MHFKFLQTVAITLLSILALNSCQQKQTSQEETKTEETVLEESSQFLSPPLISHIYTADPSAHVFNGKIYIYPSHDVE